MIERKILIKKVVLLLFICGLASSCIPNEKVVYLQNKSGAERLENEKLIAVQRVDYRLQPNDILLINFYSGIEKAVEKFYPIFARPNSGLGGNNQNNQNGQMNPYLTGYNIDKDGNIEINALGRVQAAGLTTSELKYEIERQIREKEEVNDILVGVKLSGIPYTIFGEVRTQGPNLLRVYEANIFEAIAASGDLTINADRSHVQILRQYPEGIRIHEIDVTSRDFLETDKFFLQPDDIIYVPPLKIRELGTGQTALQTFATIVSVISGTAVVIGVLTR
ncbi:polysaccharide biosynthesis/export family protein [Roseivirga sp.]|uniref:polysaccharide biosynthesis/export family protein n=1 Tax=Roseivirga sp. TaxID=1964215 RepID=UPI003B8D1481